MVCKEISICTLHNAQLLLIGLSTLNVFKAIVFRYIFGAFPRPLKLRCLSSLL
jgi:hypothetical protein